MLRKMVEMGCQLIDYEKIVDEEGRRLIFFGRYAGLAGMIDTLWAFGQRLEWEGLKTPFSQILPAHSYADLAEAKEEIRRIGEMIALDGVPGEISPIIVGFAGYGNVSRGAQEIFDILPFREISASELPGVAGARDIPRNILIKVVFREEDTVQPLEDGIPFDLQDYIANPQRYRGIFARYLPYLTVLVNAIYWEPRYPRLVTKEDLRNLFLEKKPRLRIIGDISCDIEGSIEATVRTTDPDNPVFVYEPLTGKVIDGWEGNGPVILAVDNLPCELPAQSSDAFGKVLMQWVPDMARANYKGPLEDCHLPPPLKRALILYQGKFTERYRFMEQFLSSISRSNG
jgi:alpha-aminoadipic semialdehyde synthase